MCILNMYSGVVVWLLCDFPNDVVVVVVVVACLLSTGMHVIILCLHAYVCCFRYIILSFDSKFF